VDRASQGGGGHPPSAALRATKPDVAMETTWDTDNGDVEEVPAAEKGPCLEPACVAYREHAQRELDKKDTVILRGDLEIKKVRNLLRRQQRVAQRWRLKAQMVRVST